jgi:hypothetical protein
MEVVMDKVSFKALLAQSSIATEPARSSSRRRDFVQPIKQCPFGRGTPASAICRDGRHTLAQLDSPTRERFALLFKSDLARHR